MPKPMFAKRHYEAIAQALQEAFDNVSGDMPDKTFGVDQAVRELADMFARDNGHFKRDRFLRACVPGANVRART